MEEGPPPPPRSRESLINWHDVDGQMTPPPLMPRLSNTFVFPQGSAGSLDLSALVEGVVSPSTSDDPHRQSFGGAPPWASNSGSARSSMSSGSGLWRQGRRESSASSSTTRSYSAASHTGDVVVTMYEGWMMLDDAGMLRFYKKHTDDVATKEFDIKLHCNNVLSGTANVENHVATSGVSWPAGVDERLLLTIVTTGRTLYLHMDTKLDVDDAAEKCQEWEANIKDLSRELKLGISAESLSYHAPTVGGRVSRWMSRSLSFKRSSSSSSSSKRSLRSDSGDGRSGSSGSIFSQLSSGSAHQPIPQMSPLVFDYTVLPALKARGQGTNGHCTELEVFLSTVSVVNSGEMIEFLRSQSIHSLSEWGDLQEEEKYELLSMMKRNGIVVGDRKKMLKTTLKVITEWRGEVAAYGFSIRRNSLVAIINTIGNVTSSGEKDQTLKPKRIITDWSRTDEVDEEEVLQFPAGPTQTVPLSGATLGGGAPLASERDGSAGSLSGIRDSAAIEEQEEENDYAPLVGTDGKMLAGSHDFGPSDNIVRVEELDYQQPHDEEASASTSTRGGKSVYRQSSDMEDMYVTPTATSSLRIKTSTDRMEEVNANHLRFIRNPGGLLRKAVRRSDVGGASVQSTEDGKTFYCGHTDHSISVHTMGGITATASRDMTVRLWDVDTKECTAVLLSNEGLELTCVAIVSDTVLVTGDHRGELQVWDIQSGKIMLNIPGHTGEVNCVEPIGDGRQRVISGGNDGLLMVFSVETGECEVELKDHAASVMCCSVLTDTRVASGAEDGTIILWDVENGAAIWSIQGHERGINDMTYVHHLSLVLTASSDGLIKGWEITSECYASAAATNFGEGGGGGGGGGVRRGSRLALDHSQVGPMKPSYVLKGHAGRVTAVTKLTGTTIASGGLDCTLRLWNLDGECCVKVLEGHDDYIVSLCSFKSGTELLSTSHDASMGHWEERALAVDPACIATGIQNHTAPLRRHHKIDSLRLTEKDTLEIDEGFIGRGQFGEVKKGKFKRHQDEEWSSVAIKSCLFPEGEQGADFIAEIKMMRALQSFGAHENLVQMVAFDATEAQPQLILRLAEGGSLLGLLQSKRGPPRGLSSKELLGFVLDVCSGMVFISDHFFVHRDLAARNILIGERGVCKVCDFGLSQDISGDAFYRQASNPVVAWKWSSLETLMNGKSTVQSDVWSFGILMAEIITFGAKPYPGIRNAKLLSKLQLGFRMPQENVRHASPKYFALMHNTWRENANERPTFRELCHHIANIDDMIDDDAGASAVSKAMEDVIAGRTATYGQSGSVEMGVKWYVPYCPTNLFTGRKRELQEITKNLIKNQDALDAHIEELREAQRFGIARNTSESMEQTSFRVGICSYGGAGKTQLMLRYAWDNRQYYTGGVFWVEADTALRLRRGFINILAHLGQENIISNQNDHVSVAKAAFQALSNVQGKWLLCVDAADREAEISLLAHCFIPSTLNCGHIVVTSRRSDATMINGMSIQTDCIVRLGMMSPSDASVYLYRAAKGMTTSSYDEILYLIEQLDLPEREALAALIGNTEKCGLDGLPLALEQAGAYILRTGRGFVYYRQFYERRMLELLDQQRAGKSRADGTDQDGRSVTTTWAINVADLSVEAKLVLDGIACFHPDRIPERVIIRLVSIIEEGDIIDNLEGAQYAFDQLVVGEMVSRFSLLTMAAENEGDRCYAIHRLMRLVVHARDGGVHRAEALTRALGALYAECRYWGYQTVVDASHKERERMFSLVPHIRSISNQLGGSQNIGMGQMVIKSNPKRRTSRALSDFSQERLTSSFNRSLHGLNHSGLLIEHATILRASGFIDQFTANYAGAIEAYEQALELLREATGEDDSPELAATLQQLGHVLTSKGDNSNAIIYYTQASDMLKRLHGEGNDHPSVAAILHRLATLLGQIDDWKGALKKFSESLEMKRRIHGSGKDHREIASSLHRIGNVHAKLGEYQLALTHYQASIDMYARLLGVGVDHAGIAFSYHDSGEVLVALGDTAAATKRFHTALHMRLRVYGKKPKESIAETALQLAQIYEANGNVEGAFEHYEIALGQYQRCFDNVEATVAEARSDHPKIAKILQQQAELHARAGSADAAITSYANARNMWTRLRDTSAAEICASAHDRLAGVANTVSINLSASSSDSTTPTPRPASTPTPTPTPAPASASASALTPAPAIFPVLEPREEVPTKQILTYSSVTML